MVESESVSIKEEVETEPAIELESLDAKWGDKLRELIDFSVLEVVQPTNIAEQKKKFLEGEVENPEFKYALGAKLDIDDKENKFLQLKKDILEQEDNEIIRTLYKQRINESLATMRMLRAMKEGNDRRFYRYSQFLHGEITEQEEELSKQEIFEKINEIYRKGKETNPTEVNAELERILVLDYFKGLKVPETKDASKETKTKTWITVEQLAELFRSVLAEYGWHEWQVQIEPDIVAIRVQKFGIEKPTIKIPQKINISLEYSRSLIAHEIETHVLRSESGKKGKLQLLELGLDRYIETEEGLSTYNEQILDSEVRPERVAGLWGAISLGASKTRNFRQSFDLMRDLSLAGELEANKDLEKARKRAGELAWNRTMRDFRGINDVSKPGNRYTKDICYRRGNVAVWDFVDADAENLKRLYVGKVGIQHLEMLWQLGITEPTIQPRQIARTIVNVK